MQVVVSDGGDLKRLAADLRRVGDGRALRRQLTRGIRDAVKPAVPAVRAAYLATPTGGARGGRRRTLTTKKRTRTVRMGLRRSLARAVTVQVRTTGRQAGVTIRVAGKKMPDGMGRLPKLWEGNAPRWRHPLFGDREWWYQQPAKPTFNRVVPMFAPQVRAAIQRVAADVVAQMGDRRG